MNKRVEELYAQVAGDDRLSFDSYLAEKFAELILTEVISTIYRSDISDRKQERLVDELSYKFGLK